MADRIDDGLAYGQLVLRHDRASERTHRRMMRLRYLNGDRTGVLRQLESCTQALTEELDVGPGPATLAVADVIRRSLPLTPTTRQPRRCPQSTGGRWLSIDFDVCARC